MTKQANDFFDEPDFVKDDKFLEDEKKKRGYEDGRSWWKPKAKTLFSGIEKFNRIRIFPGFGGFDWHVAGGKHWMNFSDSEKAEPVTCMQQTYGEKCLACEKMDELKKDNAEKDTIEIWRLRRVGLLQIIDRLDLDVGPQLYECPRMTVFNVIVGLGMWLFDKPAKNENGSDLMLHFDKDAGPRAYSVNVLPNGQMPLGTAEELELWLPKLAPLDGEKFYPRLSEEEQYILFFEAREARDAVREDIRARLRPDDAEEKVVEEKPVAVVRKVAPKATPVAKPEVKKEETEPEPAPEKEEVKAEAPKQKKTKPAFNLDDIKAKVAALKEKKGLK